MNDQGNSTPIDKSKDHYSSSIDLTNTGAALVGNSDCVLTVVEVAKLMNNQMLTDEHIRKFADILHLNFPEFAMQSTLYSNRPSLIKPIAEGRKHIQILNNSGCKHWICSYYDGNLISLYDTFFNLDPNNIPKEYIEFLMPLFPFYFSETGVPLKPILCPQVVKQRNGVDCGVLAIAIATTLVFLGEIPEGNEYCQRSMRSHLLEIYRKRVVEIFPVCSGDEAHVAAASPEGFNFFEDKQVYDSEGESESDSSDSDSAINGGENCKNRLLKKQQKSTRAYNIYAIRLQQSKELYTQKLTPWLDESSEVDRRVAAERVINLCFYQRSKLINKMRWKLDALHKKAMVHLERESTCTDGYFDDVKEALCGISMHTVHTEAYFSSATYKKVDSSDVLEINTDGQVSNIFEPVKGKGKKNLVWSCSEKTCDISGQDLNSYRDFLQMLLDCTLKSVPELLHNYQCTVKTDDLKKGHTEFCMANPTICKSRFVIMHKLHPHFKDVRRITRDVYDLIKFNSSLMNIHVNLKSLNTEKPEIEVLSKLANEVESRGVTIRKKKNVSEQLDETLLREKYANAIRAYTAISSDPPRLPCISCKKICCRRDVHYIVNLRKRIVSNAWKEFSIFVGIPDYSHLEDDEYERHLFDVDEGYGEEEEGSILNSDTVICKYCLRKFREEGVMPPTCVYNKLDPGEIPEVLKELQRCEMLLVQRAKAFHTIVRMGTGGRKGSNQNYQQEKLKKVKGKTFFLPIDIQKTIDKIVPPTEALNLANTLHILVYSTPTKLNLVYEDLVDIAKVILALRWLKDNNRHYAQIIIPSTIDGLLDNMPYNIIYEGDESEDVTNNVGEKPEIHDAILTQIHDAMEFSDKYTIRPLHNKNIDKTATELYQMKKIDDAPLDNRNKHLDELCFPGLYPLGINGMKEDRVWPLTEFEFVKSRMMSEDPRFRRDHEYIFYLMHQQNIRAVLSGIYYMLNVVNQKNKITAGQLKSNLFSREFEQNLNAVLRRVRGSAQFFKQAKSHLHCMSKYYGPCTFFLTFSPSEWEWDDLKQYLLDMNNDDPKYASMTVKQLIVIDPISTSRFIENKFQAVMKFLLSDDHPIGKVKHYFWRREYQGRGLQHFHLLFWNDKAPGLGIDSNEAIMDYIQTHMTCKIPDPSSATLYNNVTKFQNHKHKDYCMRALKNKSGRIKKVCRFGFPRPVTHDMIIRDVITAVAARRKLQSGKRLYDLPRTEKEQFINDYNPPLALVWEGNQDIQFVQDGVCNALIMYLSKYCTKAEVSNIDENIFKNLEMNEVFGKLFQLAMKALDHRETGLLEACDALLGFALWGKDPESVIRYVNINENRNKRLKDRRDIEQLDDESSDIFYESFIDDDYPNRPEQLEHVCLFEFATWYDIHKDSPKRNDIEYYKMKTGKKFAWKRKNMYLLSHYEYKVETNPEAFYYTLLLLFQPWRDTTELKNGCETYAESFKKVAHNLKGAEEYGNAMTMLEKGRQEAEKLIQEKIQSEEEESSQDVNMIDRIVREVEHAMDDFEAMVQHDSEEDLESMISKLNSDQKRVFDHVTQALKEQVENPCESHDLLRLFVTGEGGTGKSFLIAVIKKYTHEALGKYTAVSAPTGVAARNINGMTMHRLLQLPIDKDGTPKYEELSNEAAKVIRDQCDNTILFIFDEVSMVSNVTLAFVHLRLKQVFRDDIFGGKNVIWFGDLLQLPPVQEDPVFCNINRITLEKCFYSLGTFNIWQNLIKYDELNENMRQKEDKEYADLLSRARLGYLTESDIQKLNTRLIDIDVNLPAEKRLEQICNYIDQLPVDSICILPTNLMCDTLNQSMLDRIKSNEIKLVAQDSIDCSPRLKQTALKRLKTLNKKPRNTGGLSEEITVKIGCKLMIRRNIDVTNGLVNGTLGSLTSVTEENGEIKSVKLMIDTGKEVTIERVNVKFHVCGSIYAVRFQFPLSLAWALTVHKAQGLSLRNVLFDCGNSIFEDGQAYVGLSRVTSLEGLHLINFSPSIVRANADAIVEYNRLKTKFKDGKNCIHVPQDRVISRVPDRRWLTNTVAAQDEPNLEPILSIESIKGFESCDEVPCINAILQCIIHISSIFTHLCDDATQTDALTDLVRLYQAQPGPFSSRSVAQLVAPVLDVERSSDVLFEVFESLCSLHPDVQRLVANTIVHTRRCTECKYSTTEQITSSILYFPINETKSVKLQALIKNTFEHWKRRKVEQQHCTKCDKQTSYISMQSISELNRILVIQLHFPCNQINLTGASDVPIMIQNKRYKVTCAIVHNDILNKFSAIVRKDKLFYLIEDLKKQTTRWPRGSKSIKLLVLEQMK